MISTILSSSLLILAIALIGASEFTCRTDNNLVMLFSGIAENYTRDVLKELKGNKATFFVENEDMSDKSIIKLARNIVKNGHGLGYRIIANNDKALESLSINQFKQELVVAKKNFKKLFGNNLEFVLFPAGAKRVRKHFQLCKKLNLLPVQANIVVDDRSDPNTFMKKFDKVAGKFRNFITFQESHLAQQQDFVKKMLEEAKKTGVDVVTVKQCVSEKAKKAKKSKKKPSKKNDKHKKKPTADKNLVHLIDSDLVENKESHKSGKKVQKETKQPIDNDATLSNLISKSKVENGSKHEGKSGKHSNKTKPSGDDHDFTIDPDNLVEENDDAKLVATAAKPSKQNDELQQVGEAQKAKENKLSADKTKDDPNFASSRFSAVSGAALFAVAAFPILLTSVF